MPNAALSGFLSGFTGTSLEIMKLQQAKQTRDAEIQAQKELLDLKRKEWAGREARAKLEDAENLLKLQDRVRKQQAQAAMGQAVSAAAPVQPQVPGLPTPEGGGFTPFDPQQARRGLAQESAASAIQYGAAPGDVQKAMEIGQSGQAGAGGITQDQTKLATALLSLPHDQATAFYSKLRPETRDAISPVLIAGGFRMADLVTPEDKAMNALKRSKLQMEVSALKRQTVGTLLPEAQRDLKIKVRGQIRSEPAFKDFQAARGGFQSVNVGATRNDAVGDLAILNGIVRLLDPGSVVRPSEFETAQSAQGLIQRLGNFLNQVQRGDRLPPKVRQQFLRLAKDLIDEWGKAAIQEIQPVYNSILNGTGVKLIDVFVEPTMQSGGVVETFEVQ